MDDFNAKKARARKLKQDKYHERPRKHTDGSSTKSKTSNSKDGSVVKPVTKGFNPVRRNETNSDDSSSGDEGSEQKIQSFTKRKLASNWDRYEEALPSARPDQESDETGAQFEELLSMPISGGHLKFKHEQEWEKEKSELQTPWFQLDIQSLEKNLSTIPFFTRQNIPTSLFLESQLQRVTTRAKKNAASLGDVSESLLKIQSLCLSSRGKSNTNVIENQTKTEVVPDSAKAAVTEVQASIPQDCLVRDDDLDELLSLQETSPKLFARKSEESSVTSLHEGKKISEKSKSDVSVSPKQSVAPPTASSQPSVSLDDWLDSILDD